MAENVVANVMDQFRADLEPHVLQGISEISEIERSHHSISFRTGSNASVIELNWHGTCCVGKVLHPIFFQDSEPNGMRRILTKFCKEINLLRELKHPNIVQFLGLYYRQFSPVPIMVMEKMECSLTKLLDTYKKGSIPEHKTYNILNDVIKGLVYLHEVKQVAHRDLSSNNILVTSYLCAKIADLGSARVLNKPGGWNTALQQLTMQPGTQDFMPPEALEDPPRYDLSVDAFSFGCVTIHLITHQWPRPIGQTQKGKVVSEYERRRKFIDRMGCTHPLLLVVESCLQNFANGRPSSKQVLEQLQSIANKQQLERTQLQNFITGLQSASKKSEEIEGYRREILLREEELEKKDATIKSLQNTLKKEHQSHQERLTMQEDDSAQNTQKIHELTQIIEKMHKMIEELSQKYKQAEVDHAILKSVELNACEELQKCKERATSHEHDIRKSKQVETDLCKELDKTLKDLGNLTNRHKLLQNENSELLKQVQSVAASGSVDDSKLAQELNNKNKQVEVLYEQIKTYADSLDNERRIVAMLTLANQNYQHQLQQLQAPVSSPSTPEQGDTHKPYSEPGLSEPCPLCGKRFATTEQLTRHAATCC